MSKHVHVHVHVRLLGHVEGMTDGVIYVLGERLILNRNELRCLPG